MNELSEAARQVLRFVNNTRRPIFLTGKAGTGKTTLLREIIRTTHKNTVVVAPTGIAALNAGGVTIHSLFQLPFATFLPVPGAIPKNTDLRFENRQTLRGHFKMNRQRQAVLRELELLVIDEVSMLRPDLLDAIDFMLQTVRRNSDPFGGVQALFIGDLMQLPPVIKNEEWDELRQYYEGKYFFHAQVIRRQPPVYLELSKIYRQTDARFLDILNNLRNNEVTKSDVDFLNGYVRRDFKSSDGQHILLTTHNAKADSVNYQALEALDGKDFKFRAEVVDDFPERIFPVEQMLVLRKGAQVMFIKNDISPEKQYYNGKIGEVTAISEREIMVTFPDGKTIEADRYEWKNIKYWVDSAGNIQEEVLGTFVHYPIKLAWAITVHKSQGLTFDRAALDVSNVFQPGQAYVALSRLRSLDGLILLSPMHLNGIGTDEDVIAYANTRPEQSHLDDLLRDGTQDFLLRMFLDSFDFSELQAEWAAHAKTYTAAPSKSEKAKYKLWCKMQLEELSELISPSKKFQAQLGSIFAQSPHDANYLKERVSAAVGYFFPTIERVLDQVLLTLQFSMRAKKSKQYTEELADLELATTNSAMRLFKAKLLAEAIAEEIPLTKETLTSPEIQSYKKERQKIAQEKYSELRGKVLDDDIETVKKPKGKKGDTLEETLILWREKLPVEEIASRRKFTTQTIYSHLAKLVQAEKIDIREIFAEDRLVALARAFSGYNEETLSPLKAQLGDEFSWDELRLFRACIKSAKPMNG